MSPRSAGFSILWNHKTFLRLMIVTALAATAYFLLPNSCSEPARRMACIFVIAVLLWAFEIIPLYATSLIVVLLEIFLLGKPDGVLNMDRGGYEIFLVPFASPVIILFFGGFILAAMLHKFNLDQYIAIRLLNFLGKKPFLIMLGFMLTTSFLSMWMSNTATTAMMIIMIIPLLDKIKKDDPFRVSLALSIPFAANIGGMATPIGTPPNAIALGFLSDHGIHVNFLQWVLLATPLALIMLLLTSAILFVLFKPQSTSLSFEFDSKRSLSTEAKEVLMIALLMIILWLTSYWHGMPDALIALLGVGLFAITGFLNSKDLKEINWDILVLMWGGLALGKGMEISGLTSWIIGMPLFNAQGFILIGSFCLLALLLSTFISNTATATLLIPIAMSLPNTNLTFLAITIALSCSASMALPISTPPNAIAFSTGAISSSHMLKAGSIVSIITVLIILLGFEHVLHFFLRFL